MGSYNCPGFPPPISSGVTIIAEKLLKVMINSHKQISHLLLVHTRLGIPMAEFIGGCQNSHNRDHWWVSENSNLGNYSVSWFTECLLYLYG